MLFFRHILHYLILTIGRQYCISYSSFCVHWRCPLMGWFDLRSATCFLSKSQYIVIIMCIKNNVLTNFTSHTNNENISHQFCGTHVASVHMHRELSVSGEYWSRIDFRDLWYQTVQLLNVHGRKEFHFDFAHTTQSPTFNQRKNSNSTLCYHSPVIMTPCGHRLFTKI